MILRLLSHYWTADDHPATREVQVEDWLEDLVEFDLRAVQDACAEWRRKPDNKRPTPGQIRALAAENQATIRALKALPPPTSTGRIKLIRWRDCKTDEQKAEYHAQNYAWRIHHERQRYDERTCSADPNGEHWDTDRVNRWLDRFRDQDAKSPHAFRLTDREVRTRLQWARDHGYETWNDFLDAVQAGKESVIPYLDWYKAEFAPPPVKGFKTPLQTPQPEPPKEEQSHDEP